jgi:hypothetical protein
MKKSHFFEKLIVTYLFKKLPALVYGAGRVTGI